MGEPDGIDLDRLHSVRGILAAAARIYWRHPLLFAVLALGVMLPWQLGVLAVTGYGPLRHTHESASAAIVIELLRATLIGPLISALHIHAVLEIGEGTRPRLASVARRGLVVLPLVAAAEIMATIGIAIGFLALIIPGIVLTIRWAVVAQAAAVERVGWLQALDRSAALTRGRYGHVFGVLLVAGLIGEALLIGVRQVPLGSSSGLGSVAAGIALNTVTASFAALTAALLYLDLRGRPPAEGHRPPEHPHVRDLD